MIQSDVMEAVEACDDVLEGCAGCRIEVWHEDHEADWNVLEPLDGETRESFAYSYGILVGVALALGISVADLIADAREGVL